MKLRLLNAAEVHRCLSLSQAIDAMRVAFGQLSAGEARVPLRTRLETERGATLLMSAYLPKTDDCCIKVVSIYDQNRAAGLPVVTGLAMVLDAQTGVPLALIDSESLTALRTGGAGGLATKLLARPDARRVALFGAGVQARIQIRALLAVQTATHVTVVSRSEPGAHNLMNELADEYPDVEWAVTSDRRTAVEQAELIVCATTSSTPVFDGQMLQAGTHITGVGSFTPQMCEVDAKTIRRARIFVDSRQAALAEAGDLLQVPATVAGELGEVVNGDTPGRQSADDITFFKSVGVAVQDAVAARWILAEAQRQSIGSVVEL